MTFRQAEIGEADDLALIHRDTAENLSEIFAEADAGQQLLGLGETTLRRHPPRIASELLDRLDIGGEPGEPVGGVLLALDLGRAQSATLAQPLAQRRARAREQRLDGVLGLEGEVFEAHRTAHEKGVLRRNMRRGDARGNAPLGDRATGGRAEISPTNVPYSGTEKPIQECSRMRETAAIVIDAIGRFLVDDGWPISSHIALSMLTSLFPFLIFVTALAGFFGSQDLSDEAARLMFGAWPPEVAGPIAAEVHNVLTAPRGGLLTFGAILALYFSSSALRRCAPASTGPTTSWTRGRGGCCGCSRSRSWRSPRLRCSRWPSWWCWDR